MSIGHEDAGHLLGCLKQVGVKLVVAVVCPSDEVGPRVIADLSVLLEVPECERRCHKGGTWHQTSRLVLLDELMWNKKLGHSDVQLLAETLSLGCADSWRKVRLGWEFVTRTVQYMGF